ncbi:hypothetical protein [Bradyrhizobium sp. 2TAF24]|uniref:hypothetical protein n=1 Tax=Bradyrhizobium sp. 2TAF24 TaxID=3233011 RepID=UPI003F921B28
MQWDDAAARRLDFEDVTAPPRAAATLPVLAIGDRVRMSALGQDRHPRYGDVEGVLIRKTAASAWRVKFDGRNALQTIHRDYLERVPTDERG